MSLHRASLSFVSAITAITFAGSCTPVSGPSPKDALVSSKGKIGILRRVISMGTAGLDGVETRQKSDKKWAVMKVGGMLHKGTSLRIRRGVRVHLAMSDGSKLTLNEGSRLDLLGNRDFSLGEGEVLAEVAPDATRPLRIKTASGTLRITGTRLNVRVESEGTTLDVAKGTVEVEASGRKVSVGAGERAILREGQPPRVGLSGDLVGTLGWAREVIEAPARDVNQLRAGFGSLKARIPGRGTSEALSLSAQSVRVVVRGNIARTEVEQTFYNPSGSTLEGTYRFPLPAGASISRLALYVGDRLEEGEIVERRRARQIFARIVNDTIHPRDPALLEWVGGRTFRMKIFPIPPRASRRVILAYTQVLSGRHGRLTYVYPMESGSGRATRVGRFELKMMVHDADVAVPLFPVLRERAGGSETLRFEASDFSPAASFVASISQRKVAPEMEIALQGARRVIGHGNVTSRRMKRSLSSHRTRGPRKHDRGGFFMARLRPELPLAGRAKIRDYVFVLDRSYGMGVRGWRAENRAVEVFLSEMDVRSRFALLACDTRCDVMGDAKGRFTTPNTEGRERARRFLETMKPGGSSNLQLAFDEAARLAGRSKHAVTVIYLGDGRPTIGELREVALAQRVVRNLRAVKARLSVLQVGEDVGAIFLSQTTRKLGGAIHRLGQGDDLRRTIFEVVASQYQPTLTDLRVRFVGLPGIHHVYPRELPTITAGGEVVLVGRFDGAGHGAIRVEGRVDGRPFDRRYPVTFSRGDLSVRSNSFIPRLWAQRYIEALTVDGYAQGRPEIVRVSKAYTVLSRATAFLVLENERMYREFGVRRQRHRTTWKGAKGKSLALKDQAKAADGSAKGGSLRQEVASKKASESAHASGRGAVAAAPAASPRPSKSLDAKGAPRALRPASAPPMRKAKRPKKMRPKKRANRVRTPNDLDDLVDSPVGGLASRGASTKTAKAKEEKGLGKSGRSFFDARRRRSHRTMRPYKPVIVRRASIQPFRGGSSRLSYRAAGRLRALAQKVAVRPRHRRSRLRYQRALVRAGRYRESLRHARSWAALDGDDSRSLRALGDAEVVNGLTKAGLRSYGSAIEVRSWNKRLLASLALAYHNKGDQATSCAHRWALMSQFPATLNYHLQLARCLATVKGDGIREATWVLSDLASSTLGRRHAARIGRELAALHERRAVRRDARRRNAGRRVHGDIVISATWDRPVDLDIALVTPRGERISALRSTRRGRVAEDSLDGRHAETLALRWAREGSYRVEIVGPEGWAGDVRGTVLVRARGKTRVLPFVLSVRGPLTVATVALSQRRSYRRPRRYYR